MRSRVLLAIPTLATLFVHPLAAQRPPADTAWALAAAVTYTGDLPCADCAAIHRTLTLRPDGSYLSRDLYRGAAGDTAEMAELGRWSVTPDARRVTLRGAGPPVHFAVRGPATLRMLDTEGNEIATRTQYDLERAAAADTSAPGLGLLGAFTYMADAATFVDCASGVQLAVPAAGDFPSLESAYQQARSEPGAAVPVRVQGRVTARPAGEEGVGDLLVVERFAGVVPDARCPAADAGARLGEGTWTLADVGGVAPAAGTPAPTLVLQPEEHTASGFAGCNRFFGRYVRRGTDLRFEALGATRMACEDTMALEARFLAALHAATRFELAGDDTLALYAGGRLLATFVRM